MWNVAARTDSPNKTIHRMSGSDVNMKFKSQEMPLIGDLQRSVK
jgi:hypothetical protein